MKLKPTFPQKISLVLFGIFLSLFVVEAGLRIWGSTLTYIQEHKNLISLKKRGAYRILCLGDSMTQGAWPPFMEAALNRSSTGIQFTVIDEGWAGVDSTRLLGMTKSYLDKYRPDMVVAMMGSNDSRTYLPQEQTSTSKAELFIKSLKIYKLTRLLNPTVFINGDWTLPTDPQAPGTPPTAASLTGSSTKRGALKELITNLQTKLQLDPWNIRARNRLAQLYRQQNMLRQREAELKKALKLNPGDGNTYLELGVLHYHQGEFQQAEEELKKAIQIIPGDSRAHLKLGKVYLAQGKLQRAEDEGEKTLKLKPGKDKTAKVSRMTSRVQRKFQQAEKEFIKVTQLAPSDHRGYIELGNAYSSFGKSQQAIEVLKKGIKIDPGNSEAYYLLGRLYRLHRKFDQAVEMLQKTLEINPRNSKAHESLGLAYQEQGKFKQAEEAYKKALQINPGYRRPYHGLTLLSQNKNRLMDEGYYRKAIQLDVNGYNLVTANNYIALKNILDKKKIRLVCVQYPMRDLESLKNMFMGNADNIVFVDNGKIFSDAVKKDGFATYFVDAINGDFGHGTDKGNKLLGENIAKVILKEVLRR